MGFDFLSEMAIGNNLENINFVYSHSEHSKYIHLKDSNLSTKAGILATGLAEEDGEYNSALKNSRVENPRRGITIINGYPDLVKKHSKTSLPEAWEYLFLPNSEILTSLPVGSFMLKLDLKLTSPFYSRDDQAFYPTENPLKKEKIFGVPYLSAAAIKGLLRWSWQMCWGDEQIKEEEIIFGHIKENSKDDNNSDSRQGCLYTYPLFWNGNIGLEVINPHNRTTMTGTTPIKYEVVKKDGTTTFVLLFINKISLTEKQVKTPIDSAVKYLKLLEPVISVLIEHSGLSAKRSSGWGSVTIQSAPDSSILNILIPEKCLTDKGLKAADNQDDLWSSIIDENGMLKDINDTQQFKTDIIVKLTGMSQTQVKKKRNNKQMDDIKIIIDELWQKRQEALKKSLDNQSDDKEEKKETLVVKKFASRTIGKLFSEALKELESLDSTTLHQGEAS